MKNSLIGFEKRKLHSIEHTIAWRNNKKDFASIYELIKKLPSEKEIDAMPKQQKSEYEKQKDELEHRLDDAKSVRKIILKQFNMSENDFIKDMTKMYQPFTFHISSMVANALAREVWVSFNKYLYSDGEDIYFHKRDSIKSVATSLAGNGIKINGGNIVWCGGTVKCSDGKMRVLSKLNIRMQQPKTQYEIDAFSGTPIMYRIKREWYKNKMCWYVQITFKGKVPMRERKIGCGRVGVDIGTSTVAFCGNENVKLYELAEGLDKKHKQEIVLQRKLDRSLRTMNPDNYNEDGTIKDGRKTWIHSRRYEITSGKLKEIKRKQAAYRKYSHTIVANEILASGTDVFVEKMNFKGLQKRSKKTEISEKTGKYKKKKRFGKSLGYHAPAELIQILDTKLKTLNGYGIYKVDTYKYKASQFDHTSGAYRKKKLKERWMQLSNGDNVQRDMYSAFLLCNPDGSLEHPDIQLCNDTYEMFKALHDKEYLRIKLSNKPRPKCFGI